MNGRLVLLRHGATEWSVNGRHTGSTDIPLTPMGEQQALLAGVALRAWKFAAVVCSPRTRARVTAELAGQTVDRIDDDAAEWDYGDFEGIKTKEINADRAERGAHPWVIWRDGCPGGESPQQIGARVDRLLDRIFDDLERGDVVLVAHGHLSRVVGARWLGQPTAFGASLLYDTARICVLTHDRSIPALALWNADPRDPAAAEAGAKAAPRR